MSNASYYLYQKYVKYGNQDWIPVFPIEYAISGDTGQTPVMKQDNDPNCGYCEPEYRWYTPPIEEDYVCSGGNKYYKEVYQVSNDCGFNWEEVSAKTGSLYESGSSDCIEYRWVDMDISTDWICSGTSKYYKQKKQWKYTDSSTWADVVPAEYQMGALYEEESDDCATFKFKATYSDSTTYYIECNSSTTLTSNEVKGHSTSYSAMTSAVIGSCVYDIDNSAFLVVLNSSLTSCTIGNNVITIGNSAFQKCSGLTSINIPNSVTSIGNSAFLTCSSLTSATIGSGVTSIGSNAFNGCGNLASVNIPSGVTIIDTAVFGSCRSLSSVTIPSGVTSIGNYAFNNCASLSSVDIPDNVTYIGYAAFEKCSGMTSCTIGNSVETISGHTFRECTSLTGINVPDSVTTIDYYAFYGCSGMTNVTIGSGVTSIGQFAFTNCSALTSFTITAVSPPTLGNYALTTTNSCPIYVPSGSVNTYKSASGWSSYSSRIQAIP